MENKSHSSCINPAASSMSADESSWAMHIANFVASSNEGKEMDQEISDSSFSHGFSSSSDSFDENASFITSELMFNGIEDDESLQDTASSAAGPESMVTTMDAKQFNMPQLAMWHFVDVGSEQQQQQQVIKMGQQLMNTSSNNEKAMHECNDLRRKGLCLVPISMLPIYLR
ncbi:hypothetical protein ACP4OV_025659 [Aristida adscensionis]